MSLAPLTAELPLAVLLAWLVAATVTEAGFGRSWGAVYSPPVVIVPTVELPPATPFTAQVTVVFEDPVTVALNCCVLPSRTFALAGDTETVTEGGNEPPDVPDDDELPPLLQPVIATAMAMSNAVARYASFPEKAAENRPRCLESIIVSSKVSR